MGFLRDAELSEDVRAQLDRPGEILSAERRRDPAAAEVAPRLDEFSAV
jgi:hypothetical protein